MDSQTLVNLGLVLVFVLIGGIFAGTEMAIVTLRDSQVRKIEASGARGERIVRVHVKDFDTEKRQFVPLLSGSVDFPRVVNALRGVGYNATLVAEMMPWDPGTLARTSATPGKTQTINFYRIDRSFFFVDLPGFGYAKTGKSTIRQWKALIERYFLERSTVVLVIQLVDARMAPAESDIQLSEWLDQLKLPRMLVGAKSDKLSNNQKSAQQRVLSMSFEGQPVLMSSAKTGTGCREIWQRVLQATAVDPSKRYR